MSDLPENYVVTYDSGFLQHHTDSTDFEDYCTENGTLILKNNQGNHNLIKQTKRKMKKKHCIQNDTTNLYIDCDKYPVKLIKETENSYSRKTVKTTDKKSGRKRKCKKRKLSDHNKGDMLPVKSKLSIITHKLMPRISSLFKRTNYPTNPNMAVIEEKRDENMCVDNRSQHFMECGERQALKLFGPRDFVIRPVYTIEGNAHKAHTGPFIPTKLRKPVHNIKIENQFTSYSSLSSSSESETQLARIRQQKVEEFKNILKEEIRKEHLKYQQNKMSGTQEIQFPSKNNVYNTLFSTSPVQTQTNYSAQCINDKLPCSSSSFWNYMFEKSYKCGRKYQVQRMDVQPKQQQQQKEFCFCTPSKQCMTENCRIAKKNQISQVECSCKKTNQVTETRHCNAMCSAIKINSKLSINQLEKRNISTITLPPTLPKKPSPKQEKKQKKQKIKNQCHEAKKLKSEKHNENQSSGHAMSSKPCQLNHDKVTTNLCQKYNGEILCIHNPPCILINGCLNLPGPKADAKPDMSFWPVTETKRDIYGLNTPKLLREQSCQYHVEILNEQGTNFKAEKKIQSICHHRPPCEVVPECFKPKYDPQLENSCCHVPMCKKMPECMIGFRNKEYCDHQPKCRDIPICSRDFVMLTAKENISTQVTRMNPSNAPKKEPLVCRHEPRCILIPKCIGRAMCDCTFVNLDAIPGCIHEPMCELIPACCRKSMKEMVSVSSQYPNSCRIS